jgi:hypothetical protein
VRWFISQFCGSRSGLRSRSGVTSAAKAGAAEVSIVAESAARMALPGAVSGVFEIDGMRIAEKCSMWSSHRELAGRAGML